MTEAAKSWYLLSRSSDYVGTTLFLGGLAFVAMLWPDGAGTARARRLLTIGWLCGVTGSVAGLCLNAAWIAGSYDLAALKPLLDTTFGRVWVARALLWVLALVVLVDLSRRGATAARSLAWRIGACAVGLGILRTNGMTGHALDLPGWGQAVMLVHLLVVCLWIGGLAVLLLALLPTRDRDVIAAVLPRFSKLAMFSVATLTAAGVLLAWRLIGSVDAVLTTAYGRTLSLKLGLFGVLLLAGLVSKTWVDRRLKTAAHTRTLALSVTAEMVLAVVVLGVAAFLVTTAPGR